METPMLKRRLNPFLLATTILVLSILASLSVLYQGQLSNILQEKNDIRETLEERNQKIQEMESKNENLSEKVSSQKEDIQTYIDDNKLLESQIDSLNSTLQSLESQLKKVKDERDGAQDKLESINGTLQLICSNENNTVEGGEAKCGRWDHSYEGS